MRVIANGPGEEQTTRTANVQGNVEGNSQGSDPLRRLAAGQLLSRSGHSRARPAVRKILAETVGRGAARHRAALGRGTGVFRRRPVSVVQRYPEPAHHQM